MRNWEIALDWEIAADFLLEALANASALQNFLQEVLLNAVCIPNRLHIVYTYGSLIGKYFGCLCPVVTDTRTMNRFK